jgi:WD40 repeat protein
MIFNTIRERLWDVKADAGLSGPKRRYVIEKQLDGHSSGVYTLAANFAGTLLASGGMFCNQDGERSVTNAHTGYDGILIWDLQKYKRIDVPVITTDVSRGQVCCLRWITGRFDTQDTLCIGMSSGWILIWQFNMEMVSFLWTFSLFNSSILQELFEEVYAARVSPSELTDVNFFKYTEDEHSFKICLAGRDGIIQVWTLSSDKKFENIFSVQTTIEKPRSITFIDDNSTDLKVRVLGRTGEL